MPELLGPEVTCADGLLEGVTRLLADRSDLRDLYLHCGNVTTVDSTGLSALLMIRRHTDSAEVHLHIVDRPTCLERILVITGTLAHLTAGRPAQATSSHALPEETTAAQEPIQAHASSPDTT
ncbi:hypothetical protein SAVIM338S_07176 [Streptomyces avidinii]